MHLEDVGIAPLDAQEVRLEQDIRVRQPRGRLEAVRRQLDQQAQGIREVDRGQEPAVLHAAVANATRLQARHRLAERRLRQREREVVHATRVGRRPRRVGHPLLVREHRDQPAVARVEVEVALLVVIQVRLLEHERHPEHALPEVDRRLAVGAGQRDVVNALALDLLDRHRSTSLDLYSLRPRLPCGTSSMRVCTTSTLRSLSRIRSASPSSASRPAASSTLMGSGGSCFTPGDVGRTMMCPLTSGAKLLTTSRTADGNTFTPRTISMSSVLPMHRTRGPVRPHGQSSIRSVTWSRVRNRSSGAAWCCRWVSTSSPEAPSSSGMGSAVPGSISSGWTKPRAPRCMPSCCSHSPHSEMPMSPMPIASMTRAPQPRSSSSRNAGSPPPGSPATRTRSTLEATRSMPRDSAASIRYAA